MKTFLKVVFSLLFCATCLNSHSQTPLQDSAAYRSILQITEQTRLQHAPDRRTALFELQPYDSVAAQYVIITTAPGAVAPFRQRLSDAGIPAAKVTINLLPDSSVSGYAAGVVHLSVANLRTQPRNQAELASQVLLGTEVDLLQKKSGYYRIRTPEGYIGWLSASSVTPMSAAALGQWKAADKLIFTGDFGHAYSEPDETSLRVSDLVMGDILVKEGEQGDFIQVRYPDGRKAYVRRDLASPFNEWLGTRKPDAENILTAAKTMMGLPYLWGGTSVKGVDCSGFTKTAYYMNGLIIPRDASQQVLAGRHIEILTEGKLDVAKALKNLKPADLLFFASGKDREPDARITHVALYLGNGQFIHSAGTVRINSMLSDAPNYDDFQSRTLVAARRYIGETDPAVQPMKDHHAYTFKP